MGPGGDRKYPSSFSAGDAKREESNRVRRGRLGEGASGAHQVRSGPSHRRGERGHHSEGSDGAAEDLRRRWGRGNRSGDGQPTTLVRREASQGFARARKGAHREARVAHGHDGGDEEGLVANLAEQDHHPALHQALEELVVEGHLAAMRRALLTHSVWDRAFSLTSSHERPSRFSPSVIGVNETGPVSANRGEL